MRIMPRPWVMPMDIFNPRIIHNKPSPKRISQPDQYQQRSSTAKHPEKKTNPIHASASV